MIRQFLLKFDTCFDWLPSYGGPEARPELVLERIHWDTNAGATRNP